ncbi:MAG: hypothetical protein HY370_03745 [Proteobacteria bacterium]|nr:hypothetical protein [Pseudomonadota bacterium]
MADLEPLIKFRKHTVDEKRRFLAQLYREAEMMERQKQVVEDQMAREIETAREMQMAEAQAYLGKYLEGARRKVKAMETSLKKMDVRIAAAQEDMRAAYAEMKKIEITQRNRNEREAAALRKKEDQELDEIGINLFRRREDQP